jgi:hypothetical protein
MARRLGQVEGADVSRSKGFESTMPKQQVLASSFRPRTTVLAARIRDGVILLDRQRERYLTLNHVAADIWERLAAGALPEAIVDVICEEYDVPRDRVVADVGSQVEEFLRSGLIEPGVVTPRTSPPTTGPAVHPASFVAVNTSKDLSSPVPRVFRRPSYFRCALLLTEVKLRLAMQGYERTLDWLRHKVGSISPAEWPGVEEVRAVEYRVAMTAALYPGRAKCLEQSLTLYYLLRRQRVPARYWHGVQPYPFEAHAWIEYDGEVMNDVPEHVHQYTPLPSQLP